MLAVQRTGEAGGQLHSICAQGHIISDIIFISSYQLFSMKFKKLIITVIILFVGSALHAQSNQGYGKADNRKPMLEVEAGCGMCMFGLKDKDCLLSIRKDDKVLHVKGTGIDDHGDAHGDDGFCNATHRARVQGRAKGDSFVVTYFELIPKTAKRKGK